MTAYQPPAPVGLPLGYAIQLGIPSVPEYRNLRLSTGLTPVTEAQAACVAPDSWYGCYITHHARGPGQPQAVAMGRIIGDGGRYFHITDMATLPEHQRKGLGSVVLERLLGHIEENCAGGRKPYVNLFADPPGWRLYEKHGFVAREEFNELGMVLVLEK